MSETVKVSAPSGSVSQSEITSEEWQKMLAPRGDSSQSATPTPLIIKPKQEEDWFTTLGESAQGILTDPKTLARQDEIIQSSLARTSYENITNSINDAFIDANSRLNSPKIEKIKCLYRVYIATLQNPIVAEDALKNALAIYGLLGEDNEFIATRLKLLFVTVKDKDTQTILTLLQKIAEDPIGDTIQNAAEQTRKNLPDTKTTLLAGSPLVVTARFLILGLKNPAGFAGADQICHIDVETLKTVLPFCETRYDSRSHTLRASYNGEISKPANYTQSEWDWLVAVAEEVQTQMMNQEIMSYLLCGVSLFATIALGVLTGGGALVGMAIGGTNALANESILFAQRNEQLQISQSLTATGLQSPNVTRQEKAIHDALNETAPITVVASTVLGGVTLGGSSSLLKTVGQNSLWGGAQGGFVTGIQIEHLQNEGVPIDSTTIITDAVIASAVLGGIVAGGLHGLTTTPSTKTTTPAKATKPALPEAIPQDSSIAPLNPANDNAAFTEPSELVLRPTGTDGSPPQTSGPKLVVDNTNPNHTMPQASTGGDGKKSGPTTVGRVTESEPSSPARATRAQLSPDQSQARKIANLQIENQNRNIATIIYDENNIAWRVVSVDPDRGTVTVISQNKSTINGRVVPSVVQPSVPASKFTTYPKPASGITPTETQIMPTVRNPDQVETTIVPKTEPPKNWVGKTITFPLAEQTTVTYKKQQYVVVGNNPNGSIRIKLASAADNGSIETVSYRDLEFAEGVKMNWHETQNMSPEQFSYGRPIQSTNDQQTYIVLDTVDGQIRAVPLEKFFANTNNDTTLPTLTITSGDIKTFNINEVLFGVME